MKNHFMSEEEALVRVVSGWDFPDTMDKNS